MSAVGPMFGQRWRFRNEATEKIPYAIERYTNESRRLLNVLDKRLGGGRFLAGDYSIADIATYPWIAGAERNTKLLADFPNLKRWLGEVSSRPSVQRGWPSCANSSARSSTIGPVQYCLGKSSTRGAESNRFDGANPFLKNRSTKIRRRRHDREEGWRQESGMQCQYQRVEPGNQSGLDSFKRRLVASLEAELLANAECTRAMLGAADVLAAIGSTSDFRAAIATG